MSFISFPDLPIIPVLGDLTSALGSCNRAVLQALPGAGKTTIVPLHLMHEPWLEGRKILVLEPRRLAARAACMRMADLLGQQPGQEIGYITRLDTRTSKQARVEILTEGILTKRLQNDPELDDVGLIIFDEFHERSIHADLGLTLSLDVQENLREDLRILIMSATLDTRSLVHILGHKTPVITAPGQCHPVVTRYLPPERYQRIEHHTAAVIQKVLVDEPGSILVFLPGVPEISRVLGLLESADLPDHVRVVPLFGNQSRAEQDKALNPAPQGSRKVVLATSIAETSLTIEGIRIVIDAGLCRVSRYSPRTGMDRLETLPVSTSSADQRRGRAGRLEPGVCFRLWSKARHASLPPHLPPEIMTRDLCDLILTLADWGTTELSDLEWITPPPQPHQDKARSLLIQLGALDRQGRITPHGREMQLMGTHPRLAHLIIQAGKLNMAWTGCVTAALFMERDIFDHARGNHKDRDIRLRLDALDHVIRNKQPAHRINRAVCKRILTQARLWKRKINAKDDRLFPESCGNLLSLAFPDRIARRRSASTHETGYQLANGKAARFPGTDPLTTFPWLVIPELDDKGREAVIQLAAPIEQTWLEEHLPHMWQTRKAYAWDPARKEVMAQEILSFGKITVRSSRLTRPDPHKLQEITIRAVQEHGLNLLPWNKASRVWLCRVRFLLNCGVELPAHDDATLLRELETWLAPFFPQPIPRLDTIDLVAALKSRLSWDQQQQVEKLAPTHLTVPSGSRIPVNYEGEVPVLAVRIQELFGWQQTPKIAGGRVGLCIHLLSPAHRPVQITSDLAGFWQTGYPDVKKELKGRYPKHYWPDDPFTARATKKTKKGMGL
ncbi:ATP-dependent helicase HrpB [Desulfoplanes formicivorans]|uniref:ATP-dependent helicase HrpB n=1 Tax=Desulfoplanes formicivorans TaxID=1592317 RepID=A0A194AIT8_9BACT|nr:ATP-dependent helicase HrpB [Desulfoplanes formicivorans]GAU08986.1 ATP-dependent helicase HrpB [Desulfoplanes formicivorans]